MKNQKDKLTPLKEAELKDQILRKLVDSNGKNEADPLSKELGISKLVLKSIVDDEREYLIYLKGKFISMDQPFTPDIVSVTDEGRVFLDHSIGFVGIYKSELKYEAKERRRKNLEVLYGVVLIVLTAAAAYGTIANKLWDKKEYRLEVKIDSLENQNIRLQNEIDRFEAIPDSIKAKYLSKK